VEQGGNPELHPDVAREAIRALIGTRAGAPAPHHTLTTPHIFLEVTYSELRT
jgi:hypothetical protein